MSLVVEPDKENPEHQTVGRKAVLESSAPRTPFAEVNRQRCVRADPVGSVPKCGQPSARRRSWAPDSLPHRQLCTAITPLRNKAKDTPLREQVLKRKRDHGDHEERGIEASSSSSSSITSLPEAEGEEQLLPMVSYSCPDVLGGDAPLTPITETSPEKLVTCLSVSAADLPALSPERGMTPEVPDLSMGCEEGTPFALRRRGGGRRETSDLVASPASDTSSHSVLSDEGISSESDSPDWGTVMVTSGSQEVAAALSASTPALGMEGEMRNESLDAAQYVLEGVLNTMEERVMVNRRRGKNLVDGNENCADVASHDGGRTFLSEYAQFVACYDPGHSPACPNWTSSLTDVTPFSVNSDPGSSDSTANCGAPCGDQLDSMRSFLSDSDESFSDASAIQRHLTFEEGDLSPPPAANLDESFGFVRSSESRFDLREESEDFSQRRGKEDSTERDCLNLSVSDQRVEFIPLPPRLRSLASSPMDMQSHSHSLVAAASSSSSSAVAMQDAQTMTTVSGESEQVSPSSLVALVCDDRSAEAEAPQSPLTTHTSSPLAAHTNTIALSPIPTSVCEQGANTSVTHTVDVDTMTQALPSTSEVALSPVVVARRETDTMTTVTETADVGMATDQAECQDHSMLAAADMDSKTTMTDGTGHRSICTTMTPLKTLVKEGRRLTSDDIRKQHPRALANQLETLTVTNLRLESQARSAQQEHRRLQGALKEARQAASSRQSELQAADRAREEGWREKERQLEEQCQEVEQRCQERQSRVASLEQELWSLRAESEAASREQLKELASLQDKCRTLEETHAQCVEQHQQEVEELKRSQESDSYRHQFERAQQLVREQQEELNEMRELFSDLQTTASKQEKIHSAYQQMHKKIIALASENQSLRDSIANKTWVRKEEEEARQTEVQTLLQDKARLQEEMEGLKSTMAVHTTNLAELEKLYSVSSTDLLTATGRMVELNSELFATRKALQEVVLTKEAISRQTQDLQDQLSAAQQAETSLRSALEHTQAQLQEQADAHEELQAVSQKMKKFYEDKLENMALGVENMERSLRDMNHLEKDLYECRNIILEQRYKIDGLESDLRESQSIAQAKRAEEEDVEFFKKSNAFLEAERSVYVQSLRELEDRLQAMMDDLSQRQQTADEAEQLAQELQEDKIRLISELSEMQTQYVRMSRELSQVREEQERVEGQVRASANDLLQHMHLMLVELKRKTGMTEVPDVHLPSKPHHPPPSKPVKSKRHSRKSFVSSILRAVVRAPEDNDDGGVGVGAEGEEDSDVERAESGSYLGDAMMGSMQKAASGSVTKGREGGGGAVVVRHQPKEVTVTAPYQDQGLPSASPHHLRLLSTSLTGESRRRLHFSNRQQQLSVSWSENWSSSAAAAKRSAASEPGSAFRPVYTSSSSLPGRSPHSLHHHPPPPSEPPSSGVAKVRSLPRTEYQQPEPSGQWSMCVEGSGSVGGEDGLLGCLASLKEVFSAISRLASLLDHATRLSLHDLREENDMLRERTEILEGQVQRHSAELTLGRQEVKAKDSAIDSLQQQCHHMTQQMISFTDQKFHVRRLCEEVKRVERQLEKERGEKEVVSAELNRVLQSLEPSAPPSSSSSTQGGAPLTVARCMRDVVDLKKKNRQLMIQLEEQREHYEDLGSKAARRMRVLDENWKKAEDELYRLDELVESVKQVAERSASPSSDLQRILGLILGETKSSAL
ncbi:uncharacterized protein LOC143287894 [Babylonia areolata]|uniref:uncharacterized protein LOC143287894 n=1 Tax=Babylonia areolata TaxID=304850 RepID=UPI003FD23628